MSQPQPAWYKNAVMYQIYPRSFYDANGDGVGDLPGITAKLDYLQQLGVDGIWLSPFYPSPMADFGYDISDYCGVDPLFGTLADFDQLLHEAHRRGLKIMVDFVPNHSSADHPWFQESRSSKDNPKRDWYIWRDGTNGAEPNNWRSWFGGPAWQLDAATGQYYMHTFLPEQPDLNWANPEVRAAMADAMRFWLNRGADGFRVDAVGWLGKDPGFADDDAAKPTARRPVHPLTFDYLREMAAVVAAYPGRFMVVEPGIGRRGDASLYEPYYERGNPEMMAPFNFEILRLPWDAGTMQQFVDAFQAMMRPPRVPVYVIGNHDRMRVATRLGPEAARTAAMLLLTLPGMPFMYYGDELGMQDVAVAPGAMQDPAARRPGSEETGRDPSRTPMQWSAAANAGFSTGKPWLPLEDNWRERNVAAETGQASSMLELYRTLVRLRHEQPALATGGYGPLAGSHPDVMAFERRSGSQRLIVLLNFSAKAADCALDTTASVLLSTGTAKRPAAKAGRFTLAPHEGVILEAQA